MSEAPEPLHGLRWRLRATRRLWSHGVAPHQPFLEGEPPTPQPVGLLDLPAAGDAVGDGQLRIWGWVAFPSGPTAKVEVWLGDRLLGRARLGHPRPDLAGIENLPYVTVSGFELVTEAEPPASGESAIRVLATGPQGEVLRLGPVPVVAAEPQRGKALDPPQPVLPAAARERRGEAPRTLVVTHQLTLGGAQLYLVDLLKGLLERGAIDPVVVSSMDGVVREDMEAMGIPVHVTDLTPAGGLASHLGRVEEVAAWAAGQEFELALLNTATSSVIPGADVAARLGIPALWAIHESFPRQVLWADLDSAVRERASELLAGAAAAIFEAEATARMYAPVLEPSRTHVLPYGLDLAPIEQARAGFDREATRQAAGVPVDARLIVCVGTVEPRKAQVPLAEAFESVAERHPEAFMAFVGGKSDPHSEGLSKLIEQAPHGSQMRLIPITPDVQDWYAMADLLVCASDVESLPRTVLEAMAWETPVLATEVFGLPELIEDGVTGWLCEAGDVRVLAAGLDRVLGVGAEELRDVAVKARALVERRHSLERYAGEVADLMREAARGENLA